MQLQPNPALNANKMIRLGNGDSFNGLVDNASQSYLSGTYNYRNGDVYNGEFRLGMKHGFGTYTYSTTGEHYEGEWKNDVWEGKGTYWVGTPAEVRIVGIWERGLLNGEAEVVHRNGDKFVGQFRNGKKMGKGKIFYHNGGLFVGEFHDDMPNGPAQMTYISHDGERIIYDGYFTQGEKCGRGTLDVM
jgi:hypothetical protein